MTLIDSYLLLNYIAFVDSLKKVTHYDSGLVVYKMYFCNGSSPKLELTSNHTVFSEYLV